MTKRLHDGQQTAFITLKFKSCMLIIQRHPTLPNPQPSIKLLEENGRLWEAFYTNEESREVYDGVDQMSDAEIEGFLEYTRYFTVSSFREANAPGKTFGFELKVKTHKEAIVSSTFLSHRIIPQIANGTVVPEFIAMHKEECGEQMSADFFVKYKHQDRDFGLNMTCYDSILLTFLLVPEFASG
jgi:hypothetical protein